MRVAELAALLERYQQIFAESGARAQAGDFARVVTLLREHDDLSIDEFERMARDAAETTPDPSVLANEVVVKKYTAKLQGAGLDRPAFEALMEEIKADGAVKKPEADAIAFAFIGGRRKYASKKAAFEAIEDRFLDRVRSHSKKEQIRDVYPW